MGEFPQDFEVPKDQGGPGKGKDIGGFGGDPDKNRADHRTAVQSAGKAPVVLIHGQVGAAESTDWNMLKLKDMLIGAGYPEELIWAPSYLGGPYRPTGNGTADTEFPHAHNVEEIRDFIDGVCEYLDVPVVDIIAHSLGCTLAYATLRGLTKQDVPRVTSWNWDEPKKWHRVGTLVALSGAFHGFGDTDPLFAVGEWKTSSEFMRELLKEDLGGGGETPFGEGPGAPGLDPHKISYFCAVARGDFVNQTKPGTGVLEGAVNVNGRDEFYDYPGSDRVASHKKIKEDPKVFKDFLRHLNSIPPVSPATITVDKASGRYDGPLAIAVGIDPPENKTVNCVARRISKEIRAGFLEVNAAETLEEALESGQTLTLPRNGMWEVVFGAEGAAEDVKRTYWVGIPAIEVTIPTDNATPFDGSLTVMATTNSARARLFYSVDSTVHSGAGNRMWQPEASVTITENAIVNFIAIDETEGIASEIVSKSFKKRTACEDTQIANAWQHFLAGRIDEAEREAYARQFGGFFQPFALCLSNGEWVLSPEPTENPLPPTVTVTPGSGTYTEPITVTLAARDKVDASPRIYYTLDGSTPMTSSPFFTSSGQITFDTNGTRILKYFAQNSTGTKSDTETKTYEMNVTDVRPVIKVRDGDPRPGRYPGTVAITIEALDVRDEHVTVHYTLDGSRPDENSPSFRDSKEFGISGNGNHAISCYARDSSGNETYETFPYSIDDQKYPETGIAPSRGGTYAGGVEITLTPDERVEWTKYTTDGSVPDDGNGIPYTEPFTLTETTVLKWGSKDPQGNVEPVNTAVFTVTQELQEAVFGNDGSKDGYVKANADGSGRSIGAFGSLALGVKWDGKINRAILHFDTASIPDNATVTKAHLRVEYFSGWEDPWAEGRQLVVDINTGYFGSSLSLQTGDWGDAATAEAVATIKKFTGGTKDSDQFSQGGLDAINKAGVTQIRLRFDPDPSSTPRYVSLKQGASAKLFVEYAV